MAVPWAGLVLQNEMTYSWDIISSPDIVSVASWVISNPLFPDVTLRCPHELNQLRYKVFCAITNVYFL